MGTTGRCARQRPWGRMERHKVEEDSGHLPRRWGLSPWGGGVWSRPGRPGRQSPVPAPSPLGDWRDPVSRSRFLASFVSRVPRPPGRWPQDSVGRRRRPASGRPLAFYTCSMQTLSASLEVSFPHPPPSGSGSGLPPDLLTEPASSSDVRGALWGYQGRRDPTLRLYLCVWWRKGEKRPWVRTGVYGGRVGERGLVLWWRGRSPRLSVPEPGGPGARG